MMKMENIFIILITWYIFDVVSSTSDIYQNYCLIHGNVYWIKCDNLQRACNYLADPNLAIDFLSLKIKVINFFNY